MKPKYAMGDSLYLAQHEITEKWITCPDCFGKKTLKVILGDDTELIIPCQTCAIGYDPPRGMVKTFDTKPDYKPVTITGMEISENEVRYRCDCRSMKEGNLFRTEEEAIKRGEELAAQAIHEESIRLQRKERQTRSWAWHVTYYRGIIQRAKAEIVRSEKLLGIATAKTAKGSNA